MERGSRSATRLDKRQSFFQRRESKDEPPLNMHLTKEERRILLLGSQTDAKASCGNTILGRKRFSESPSTSRLFERYSGHVLKRHLMIINTPDLQNLALFSKEKHVRECLNLAYPGPDALLLVFKSGTFTDQERESLKLINIIFGEGASEFVIVIFMHEEKIYLKNEYSDTDRRDLESLLQTCKRPPHHLRRKGDKSQVQNLLESIEKMVRDNGDCYLKIPEEITRETSKAVAGSEKSSSEVRIVLIGRTGVGKSATGNTILGRDAFESQVRMASVTKRCQRESGTMCGRAVTVVDTPGLFDTTLTNDKIQQEIMRCIELSAPGPHVFLLVISVGRFTQEERETLQLIQKTFGQKSQRYTIVLFTQGDKLNSKSIEDYVKEGDLEVKKLINDCGGRFHMFNNNDKGPAQVESLLNKIDMMVRSNDETFYNYEMFQEAETALELIQQYKKKEAEVKQEMEAIKAKYEADIQEYKEKLEEEKAKGKIRELLLMLKERKQSKKYDNEAKATVYPEQLQYKAHLEQEINEKQKQKDPLSGKTDADTQEESAQGATGYLTNTKIQTKKGKVFNISNLTKRKKEKKQRQPIDMWMNETKAKETETKLQMKPEDHSDTKTEQDNIDVPELSEELKDTVKDEGFLQQMKEIEEHMQKMVEEMKMYKKYAEEIKNNQEGNTTKSDTGQKKKSKCFIQ